MKKKITVGALLVLLCSLLLCGCALIESDPSGKTPYKVASEHGYDGSEGSWLASCSTPSSEYRTLYEEARADGYSGTYVDFLERLSLAENDDTAAVNRAVASIVKIEAAFRLSGVSEKKSSLGSGIIYSVDLDKGNAYIITNFHVVYLSSSVGTERISHVSDDISVYLYGAADSAAIKATYVGGAMQNDLAVLSVENSDILRNSSAREVVAADSDSITVGERAYAVGNADGRGFSVTEGIVSVTAEYINLYAADDRTMLRMLEIRTDAAVNHGNSGGGLFNSDGKLIGVVNARSEASGITGFGYAIPANLALTIVQNILDNRANRCPIRAVLGATSYVSSSRGVYDEDTGKIYIEETISLREVGIGSISYGAGLRTGDTIYSVTLNGRTRYITRLHMLTAILFEVRLGDTLTFTVSRNGEEKLLSFDLVFSGEQYFTEVI